MGAQTSQQPCEVDYTEGQRDNTHTGRSPGLQLYRNMANFCQFQGQHCLICHMILAGPQAPLISKKNLYPVSKVEDKAYWRRMVEKANSNKERQQGVY